MKNIAQKTGGIRWKEAPDFHKWTGILIMAATFLAYLDTLALGFVFDDHVLIVNNDSIRSWRYFPTYFTSHIWAFRYPHLLANYYRPLFLTWLRLNDAMFGLHAWGWHLTSALAHVAVTYLVYRLALWLLGEQWLAATAGLIFGLHPIHAEAVADVTSIQEPLSTLFTLAAILAIARSRETHQREGQSAKAAGFRTPSRGWNTLALVFASAALLCKESGMVLPILVMSYVWVYAGNGDGALSPPGKSAKYVARFGAAIGWSVPFWIIVLVYVPARIHALKGFTHVITPLTLRTEIFTIPSILLFYVRLLLWPVGLSCYYDTPYVSALTWSHFVMPAIVLVLLAAALCVWYFKTRQTDPRGARAMELSLVWMVLTLVPVLNFRFLPDGEIAHDRYLYLPSVGFVILAAVALGQARNVIAKFLRPALGIALATLLLVGMGLATARQNLFWADDLTLNSRAHAIAPNNAYAATSLAAAIAEKGMDGTAMSIYADTLARQPNFWRANVNLAYLDYAHGNYPDAAHYFARACSIDPTDGDEFLYLGMSLLRIGRLAEAENAVRTALLVRPQGRRYHLGLGLVLKAEGDLPQAKLEFGQELATDPENPQAKSLLAELSREMSERLR